jgi:hypothetical protein
MRNSRDPQSVRWRGRNLVLPSVEMRTRPLTISRNFRSLPLSKFPPNENREYQNNLLCELSCWILIIVSFTSLFLILFTSMWGKH